MNNRYYIYKFTTLILKLNTFFTLFIIFCTTTFAQTIKGTVKDLDQNILFGATIYNNSNTKSTLTNENGEFSIPTKKGKNKLIISYVGYSPQVINVDGSSTNLGTIVLKNDRLDEVVISGTLKQVSKLKSAVQVELYSANFFKATPKASFFEAIEGVNGVRPQLNCNICNTEYGVVGFDYGYAMASPNTLTIWEAQFGDFSNGAQIMIEQYISCGEDKWKTPNGIVMLLPHGYEGQGAEHSSGRMERYLQLCAKDNMFVVDCTTPANMYHVLRRQLKADFRKPLIAFTPKSLLRHPKVVSSVEEFANGSFQMLIDDASAQAETTQTLVFVTGKFYYDLLEEQEALGRTDIALVRIEQLFPLPEDEIDAVLSKYIHADDIVWAQEEPRNMGAYAHILMHIDAAKHWRVASRRS